MYTTVAYPTVCRGTPLYTIVLIGDGAFCNSEYAAAACRGQPQLSVPLQSLMIGQIFFNNHNSALLERELEREVSESENSNKFER